MAAPKATCLERTLITLVANDKGDNKMIPGAVYIPLGIFFAAEENLTRSSYEGTMRPVITSNGVPDIQMRSVGSHSTSGRGKEGKKERTG